MNKRILVIDDEEAMRNVVRLVLEERGYIVDEAENGKHGVRAAFTNPPDLVVCDIRMPEMDGFQTLEQIRKNPLTAAIPFLFLTGEEYDGNLRRGMQLGANDFLRKPFDEKDLLEAVRVRLEQLEHIREDSQKALESLKANIMLALPHELRTPLTGILGLAEILQSDVEAMSLPEIKEMVSMMHGSAQRLHRTLEKFWVYTQLEMAAADPATINAMRAASVAEAHEVIREAAMSVTSSYQRASDLKLALEPISLPISGQYLSRLVQELVDNAMKFSSAGSEVAVRTTTNAEATTLTISDGGRGFTQEEVRSVNTFVQFDRRKNEQQGIGLGLATAKRIVDLHGGSLVIRSVPTQSTHIHISFPTRD